MEAIAADIDSVLRAIGTPGEAAAIAVAKERAQALMARFPPLPGLTCLFPLFAFRLSIRARCRPTPRAPSARCRWAVIFPTLYIDLIGFSIVFPLGPQLIEYYLKIDGQSGFLGWMLAK